MIQRRRNFQTFLKDCGDVGSRNLTLEYVAIGGIATIPSLADKYNLTEYAVIAAFEHAIVNCLVSYQIALLIKEKVHNEEFRNNHSYSKLSANRYYERKVFPKRLDFVKNFDDGKVKSIVEYYLALPCISTQKIAEDCGLSLTELNIVLEKAIIFNIVDTDTLSKLVHLQIDKCSYNEDIRKKLDNCISLRNKYVKFSNDIQQHYFNLVKRNDYAFVEDENDIIEFIEI